MKKRTQSGVKKTSSMAADTAKKSQNNKKSKPSSQTNLSQQTDSVQQSHIQLDTISDTNIQEETQDTRSFNSQQKSGSWMVEIDQNTLDYDPALMEEIQKEIYEAEVQRNVSPIDKLRAIEDQFTNDQEITSVQKRKKKESEKIKNKKRKVQQKEAQISLKSLQKDHKANLSTETQKIQSQSEEEPIFVPQKTTNNIIQSAKSLKKTSDNPLPKIGPNKKIKTSEVSSKKFLNFTIDLKLLKGNLSVKKIVKCLESENTSDRWGATFLIQTENGDELQVSNKEMVSFYKDPLIEYYQGIHFSQLAEL